MITTQRFMKLRVGKDNPANEEERLELARSIFRSEMARIEQAEAQRKPPGPVEKREMEREAVRRIVRVFVPGEFEKNFGKD